MTAFLTLIALVAALNPAHADVANGYVVQFQYQNSANSDACYFVLGSSSSSTAGTTYALDDVSGEFAASCDMAWLAMYFNDYVSVTYTTSGSTRYVEGISSSESGNITYFATNDATGTGSADRCYATMSSSSGSISAYVDDNNPEENGTCAMLALMHFYGSTSWSVSRSSSEINYLYTYY